ncbi:MAG: metal ABC transporter permease [Pseudanabaenaceae cyanobacterium]|jgi:manganese/iron transport system permease protein
MPMLIEILLEPLQFGFMQRALVVAILVGILCAVIGSYLLVQRLSLLGDAISHSVLPGVAIAFITNINLFVGAFIAGLISALCINIIRARSQLKEDAAMGVVFSAFFAAGITLITLVQKENKIDLNHFLFGNLLSVTSDEVWLTAGVTGIILTLVFLFYKELHFYTFDALGAQAVGLPVHLLSLALMILTAMTIVISMKAVGVILILAMLITPAATAFLLTKRLHSMMIVAALVGIGSSLGGMYISYYQNLPSGPTIVLLASLAFICSFLFSPKQGLFSQGWRWQFNSPLILELRRLLKR